MNSISAEEQRIVKGDRLTQKEAMSLVERVTVEELCELADRLRKHFSGSRLDTCSIMNARSGRCTEDCKWCSQSKFHKSDIETYHLVGEQDALREAEYTASKGVRRFSLVTSGRTMSKGDIDRSCLIFDKIQKSVLVELCASMGLLDREQLEALRSSGVERYHCNLETAPSYFAELCTTHTAEEKMATIRAAQRAGMEVCSGGIIGMGESMEQRVELAVTLRELGVRSVPLNVLNPIKGTAMEGTNPLTDGEILQSFAIFRIINPEAHLRFAGGRTLFKHLERKLLHSGVSASIVGDMLTTSGSDIDTDKKMFIEEGFIL